MKTNVTEVVNLVLTRLDESPSVLDDAVEYGSPDFDLRELVKTLLPTVAESVVLAADPSDIAESVPLPGEPVRLAGQGVRRILLPLPDQCLRFLYLRMSDWGEEIRGGMELDSVSAGIRRLWSARYGNGYGSAAVAITHYGGKRALEIFGSGEKATVADSGYIPRPEIAGDWLHFPSSLMGSLVGELVRTIKEIRR